MRRHLLLLGVLGAMIAGGGSDNRPSDCAGPVTVEAELTADALAPSTLNVCRDQAVTLEIASEVDGIIHIHGYDDVVPATAVTAGEELVLEFPAELSGQYPIELHPEENPQGVDVGILTVHEP